MKTFLIILLITGFIGFLAIYSNRKVSTAGSLLKANGIPATGSNSEGQSKSAVLNESKIAPEFVGITKWFNPEKPLTIAGLRGKVVLIDFWTNQCINCIHTLPYVTRWYDKYRDQGLVVIGVHTPELAYERTAGSIEEAIRTYNIHYPIAQDNNYATWKAYDNQYWPAAYLIDKKGIIRRTHFGEGEYEETEQAIQELLKESS